MLRVLRWVTFVASCVVVVDAIARPHVDVVMFAAGGVSALVWGLLLLGDADVLADHPDERDELDELRRRRGAAGWQKPVAPPRDCDLPGGLPRADPYRRRSR